MDSQIRATSSRVRKTVFLGAAFTTAAVLAASCGGTVAEKVQEALPGPSDPGELLANRVGLCESSDADEAAASWWYFRFVADGTSVEFDTNYQHPSWVSESMRIEALDGSVVSLRGGGEGEVSSFFGTGGDGAPAELELTWSEEDGVVRLGDIGSPDSSARGWFEADADDFKGGSAEVRFMIEESGPAEAAATFSCRLTGQVEPDKDGRFDADNCELALPPVEEDQLGPSIAGCGKPVVLSAEVLNAENGSNEWIRDTTSVQNPPTQAVPVTVDGCLAEVGEAVPVVGSQGGDGYSDNLGFWQTVTVFESPEVAQRIYEGRVASLASLANGCDPYDFPNGSLVELNPVDSSSARLFGSEVARVDQQLPAGASAWVSDGATVVVLQRGPYYSEMWLDSDDSGELSEDQLGLIERAHERMS